MKKAVKAKNTSPKKAGGPNPKFSK